MIPQNVFGAVPSLENPEITYLYKRQSDWPDWQPPSFSKLSNIKEDLFYPNFFEGEWQVISIDLEDPEKKEVKHLARFKYNSLKRLVGDRSFNAESLGREIFGNRLIKVKDAPDSSNRQVAFFKGNEFLETKVIDRRQAINQKNILFTDEVALQIFHSASISRIDKVETLSRYQKCRDLEIEMLISQKDAICGEQLQAIYKEKADGLRSEPLKTNHYKLFLIPSKG